MSVKMRVKGEKEWEERELTGVFGQCPIKAEVECFAEEWGLKEGDIIEVYRNGKYKVTNVWVEYSHDVEKIK